MGTVDGLCVICGPWISKWPKMNVTEIVHVTRYANRFQNGQGKNFLNWAILKFFGYEITWYQRWRKVKFRYISFLSGNCPRSGFSLHLGFCPHFGFFSILGWSWARPKSKVPTRHGLPLNRPWSLFIKMNLLKSDECDRLLLFRHLCMTHKF